MAAVNQPYVTANLVPDASVVSIDAPRVLLVGTVPTIAESALDDLFGLSNTIYLQGYQSANDAQTEPFFGTGCMMRERLLAAQSASAGVVPIDMLLVKNTISELTAAESTITFAEAGSGVSVGQFELQIADSLKYSASVKIDNIESAVDLATEVLAQLNAIEKAPFSASLSGAVITLSWKDGFATESTPIHVVAPFGCKYTATVSAPTVTSPSGLINFALFDTIGDNRYTHILWPDYYFDSSIIVTQFLDERFNTFNDVLSGAAWTTLCAEDVPAAQSATSAINTQSLIVFASRQIDGLFGASVGCDKKRFPDGDIAFLATAHARMLTTDADLTDLGFIAEGLNDYRGGIHMASFPAHNIVIAGTEPSNPRWYFSYLEQSLLNDANVSTYGVNRAGTVTVSGNLLTMWKTDSAGNVNLTWKQAEFLYTSMAIREYMDSAARIKFANQRMTGGDTVIGYSMVNRASVEEWMLSQYRLLGGLALTVKGADADKAFVRGLTVSLQPAQTRIDITATYPIVTHVGIVNFTVRTSTNYTA